MCVATVLQAPKSIGYFLEIFKISGVSSHCVKLGESSRTHFGRLRGPSQYNEDFWAFTVVNVMTL